MTTTAPVLRPIRQKIRDEIDNNRLNHTNLFMKKRLENSRIVLDMRNKSNQPKKSYMHDATMQRTYLRPIPSQSSLDEQIKKDILDALNAAQLQYIRTKQIDAIFNLRKRQNQLKHDTDVKHSLTLRHSYD